jgi:copper chaperone CopZ
MRQATLRIDGMTCDGCVRAVEHALKRVNGVSEVSVLLGGEAYVTYDEARTDRGALLAAVQDAGYCAAEDRDVHRARPGGSHGCRG